MPEITPKIPPIVENIIECHSTIIDMKNIVNDAADNPEIMRYSLNQ